MKEVTENLEDTDFTEKQTEYEKKENQLTKLMQTLVDDMESLKEQSVELKSLLKTQYEAYANALDPIGKSYAKLTKYVEDVEAYCIEEYQNNKLKQNQNSKVEYILFGRDTPFSSKLLLGLLTLILFCFLLFEYGTPLLIEKSELKNQRDDYKLYYNYSLLKAFENSDKNPGEISSTFAALKARDTLMIKYIDSMTLVVNKNLRKEELESELKTLEK